MRELFSRRQVIPPGVSYRVMWRTEVPKGASVTGPWSKHVTGIPDEATITFRYRGADRKDGTYEDAYTLDPSPFDEIAPGATSGHNPPEDLSSPDEKNRHKQMQHVIEALGELRR